MRFRRMMFPWTNAFIKRPFVFPVTVLYSTMLSLVPVPCIPMPKLFPWAAYPFPLSRFPRSRLRLAPPKIHMPPQAKVAFPFRTEILPLISWPDPPPTNMPEKQLVETVTPVTVAPLLGTPILFLCT